MFVLMFLFSNFLVFSQHDSLPELMVYYSDDKSILLTGYKNDRYNSDSLDLSNPKIPVDTLIKYFDFQLDYYPKTTYLNSIQHHLNFDSLHFSDLIIKTDLRMSVVKYGYAGAENYEKLSKKYGVKYYSGGCIYSPTDFELDYSKFMQKLLTIRNGKDWQEKYNSEVPKRD